MLPLELVAMILESVLQNDETILDDAVQLALVSKQWYSLLKYDAPLHNVCKQLFSDALRAVAVRDPHDCRTLSGDLDYCCDTLEYSFWVSEQMCFQPRSDLSLVSVRYETRRLFGNTSLSSFAQSVRIALVNGPFDSMELVDDRNISDSAEMAIDDVKVGANNSALVASLWPPRHGTAIIVRFVFQRQ